VKRALAITALLAILAPAGAWAHPAALGASVTPQTVNMAGQIVYTIYAEWPAGWSVAPPRLERESGSFEVKDCQPPQVVATPSGGGRLAMSCRLTVFDAGQVALPTPPLRLLGPDGKTETDTPPEMTVESIAPQVGEKPRPAKGPETIERDWRKILLVAGAVFAALSFFTALIWLIVRRLRNRPPKAEKLAPPEAADVRALRRLADPQLQELMVRRDVKPFYSELTEIVREYLEGRFAVPALERTTSEILLDAERLDLKGHKRFLSELLRTGDLAKFADAPIPLERWPGDREGARRLVEDTRPAANEGLPSPRDTGGAGGGSSEPPPDPLRLAEGDSPEAPTRKQEGGPP
jgi:hypothetical protein